MVEAEQLNSIEGGRGIPSVNPAKPKSKRVGAFVVLCLVVLGLASAAYFALRKEAESKQGKRNEETLAPKSTRTFTFPEAAAAPTPAPAPHQEPPATHAAPAKEDPPPAAPQVARPRVNKSNSDFQAKDANAAERADSPRRLQAAAEQGEGALSGMLTGTKTPPSAATLLRNRQFLLAKGAVIPCVLRTALNSTVAGFMKCETTRDVYSDDGSTLLLESGTEFTGEYASNIKQGQNRIFALWTQAKTPHGVRVDVNSPGADSLGGNGMEGYIDTHFWERFGGAMMLSVIDDAFANLANRVGNNNNNGQTITFGNTSDASQQMAAEALRNSINIPPTLYKNQGESITIFVARDLTFENVYGIE